MLRVVLVSNKLFVNCNNPCLPTTHKHTRSCSLKLAAATADRVVHVFDEHGEKKDKFKTKGADPNSTGAYLVRGLAFSPDSTKLAVAQSDNIVFVYRCVDML